MANISVSELKTVLGTISAGIKIKYLRKTGNSMNKALALQAPVQVDLLRLNNPGFNYANYLTPGLWATAIQQILFLIGSLLICREFETGRFRELWETSERNVGAIALGKIAPYFLWAIVLLELFTRVFFPLFDLDIRGSASAMVAYSVSFVIASLCFGFMLSVLLRNSVNALKGVLLVAAPAFIISGYTWPLSQMPFFIRGISSAIPLTTYLKGFRKIYQEGAPIWETLPEIGFLLLIAAVTMTIALILLRRRIREEGLS